MTRVWKLAGGVATVLATLLVTAVPAVADYPPGANVRGEVVVRGQTVVSPGGSLAFTGSDLAPLLWAITLFAVGLVLLSVARRTVPADR